MISNASFSDSLESSRSANACAVRAADSNPATMVDDELVTRFNSGDDAAFEEIVMRYRGKMHAVALSLIRNQADAEEIAQDTFVHAYRSLAGFRGESSLSSWLHCITLNLARTRYWYFYRRCRHTTQSLDCAVGSDNKTTFADLIASDAPDPAHEAANRENSDNLSSCINKLSAHLREILMHRYLLDDSYEEIACILGLSLGTVKSRIARARKNLRRLLAPGRSNHSGRGLSPTGLGHRA